MAFATIDVTKGITGTIPVANGGTGLASGTSGQFLKFTGSTTVASAAVTSPTETYFYGHMNAEQTGITNNAWVKVQLNTIALDTASSWDSSNYRWTVGADNVGKYFITGTAHAVNNSVSTVEILQTGIYKNGAIVANSGYDQRDNRGGQSSGFTAQITLDLSSASDYIELYCYPKVNNTNGLKIGGIPSGVYTSLSIIRVA